MLSIIKIDNSPRPEVININTNISDGSLCRKISVAGSIENNISKEAFLSSKKSRNTKGYSQHLVEIRLERGTDGP